MFSEREATTHKILAKVVPRPEIVGSLHDEQMARALGYPAALVPGIDVYAYLARLTLASWGADWLTRGVLQSSSLRPVYDGEELVVHAGRVERTDQGRSVELAVYNAAGTLVASASASLGTHTPPAPDLATFPILARPVPVPPGDPASMRVGMRFSCVAARVSAEANARIVAEFLETSPTYVEEGIVHPAFLQRLALKNAHASFAHGTPPIYIATRGQHFSPARVGDVLEVSGAVTKLWERKGHHYMDSEQLVVANRERAVMLIHRTTIYQARQAGNDHKPGAEAVQGAAQ